MSIGIFQKHLLTTAFMLMAFVLCTIGQPALAQKSLPTSTITKVVLLGTGNPCPSSDNLEQFSL